MDFDEYQELSARTRANDLDGKTALAVAALGLAGETGEVADLIKKFLGHGHNLDRAKLSAELGDVLFYIAWLCSMFDLGLSDVAYENIAKLAARYPDGFSSERSRNRE